jgi:uncharacterized membrane protein YdjX (TVP38/TMEM64 family)
MRLIGIFILLAALLLMPFLLWAERLDFDNRSAADWLQGYGQWAWAVGLLLLVADLVLPVPGTAVMAALGYLYGAWLGGLIGAFGSFLGGAVAYGLSRLTGRRGAVWLVGEKDLQRGEQLFANVGGWLVVVSRWLPLLPEVIACLAGLVRMRPAAFFAALLCGCAPLGFTYAAVGASGTGDPLLALLVSALLPPALWLVLGRHLTRRARALQGMEKGSSSPTDGP